MLRVVIDTSSLISYALTRDDLMQRVVAHWRAGTFSLLSSPATRTELSTVLSRPCVQSLAGSPLDELLRGVERFSEHVSGELQLTGVSRDGQDDKFLSCAVEGGADYLVSIKRTLLDVRRYRGVAILSPGQFLLALELYPMEAAAMALRFSRDVLAGIPATVPLEPGTAARVAKAVDLG